MTSKYRYRVLVLLAVIVYLDRVLIAVVGPRMQQELGISPDRWGWVVGIFAMAYAAFEIPSGVWGDRYGPRRVLTRIVLWWSAFTAFTGLASNYWLLLAIRFSFGAGEAGAYPNIAASISRWFPRVERARALGTVLMASQIGGALTPLVVVPGLSALAVTAAMLTPNKFLALIFLAVSYLGVTLIQPTAFAVCLDVAPRHGGAVVGAMNTAAQVGAFLSSIAYGYLVALTGSYDLPLLPMVVMLVFSALLWLKIDPTEPLVAADALEPRFASSP